MWGGCEAPGCLGRLASEGGRGAAVGPACPASLPQSPALSPLHPPAHTLAHSSLGLTPTPPPPVRRCRLRVHGLIVGSPEKKRADPAVLRGLCSHTLPSGKNEVGGVGCCRMRCGVVP